LILLSPVSVVLLCSWTDIWWAPEKLGDGETADNHPN
jgi:hypothetical protein